MNKIDQPKKYLILILILSIFQLTACNTVNDNVTTSSKSFIKTELYFGLSKPDGGNITENEWQDFVKNYITPSFKEGITIIDSKGQWMMANGEVIKENSKIVIILHKNLEELNLAIEKIKAQYKNIFNQEAVLEVNYTTEVSF